MRLFVAIEVPEAIRRALGGLVSEQRCQLPPANWVAPGNIHLTVDFLGERAEADLERLAAAIGEVSHRHAVLRLTVAGPGTFPRHRPASVAWVGLSPSPELDKLQSELRQALDRALDRPPEDRPFHPHLTLARCRPPWPRGAVERWQQADVRCDGREFQVTYIDLMQSRTTPSGPFYERVRRCSLEG